MRSYVITVNGTVYDVTVEETTGNAAAAGRYAAVGAGNAAMTGGYATPAGRNAVTGNAAMAGGYPSPTPAAGSAAAAVGNEAMPGRTVSASPASVESVPAAAGAIPITAGAAGKVVDIAAAVGASVSKGDPVVILEIMKMETSVVAPQDGILASIEVEKGQSVAAGDVLASMNG
ncbi:MAG: acetyl-CoA carboxylase biotin carboxyl carrier protein subunit [Lachnospiraceae bacterium]|nr:acetyl-CoA carboxylase biotin carboxyl carrier protein subunit [Lachnospiraceae bacterium]